MYISIGPAFMWLVIFCILEQYFIHIRACILKELVTTVENDESDLAVAEYAQLVSLLHQAELPFCERDLSVSFVIYPRNLDLFPSHFDGDVCVLSSCGGGWLCNV